MQLWRPDTSRLCAPPKGSHSNPKVKLILRLGVRPWVLLERYLVVPFAEEGIVSAQIENESSNYMFPTLIIITEIAFKWKARKNCDPDAKKTLIMSKMKNVAKIEIVLHDPYSNALCSVACPSRRDLALCSNLGGRPVFQDAGDGGFWVIGMGITSLLASHHNCWLCKKIIQV